MDTAQEIATRVSALATELDRQWQQYSANDMFIQLSIANERISEDEMDGSLDLARQMKVQARKRIDAIRHDLEAASAELSRLGEQSSAREARP